MTINDVKLSGCLNCNSKSFTIINKGEWGVQCDSCGYKYYWQKFAEDDYRLIREYLYKVNEDTGDASKWNLEKSEKW